MLSAAFFARGADVSSQSTVPPPQAVTRALESLHRTVMLRTAPDGAVYGANETDPLLWWTSTDFRSGESRERLIRQLEAFAQIPDDELRRASPAQRALVQNRLWAVFDFVHLRQNETPQTEGSGKFSADDEAYLRLLVRVMRKLALSEAEIAAIPDPLDEAVRSGRWPANASPSGGADVFLPPDLSDRTGRWAHFGRADGTLIAPLHLANFGGRSSFSILVRFPDDASGPTDYFKAVADVVAPWRRDETRPQSGGQVLFVLNPEVPELPRGAQFALIRRVMVIDRQGQPRATPLTLSVQLRRYWANSIPRQSEPNGNSSLRGVQSVAEFQLETDAVASGAAPRLHAIAPEEKGFLFFQTHGNDQLEQARDRIATLRTCVTCHSGPGLASLNSVMGIGGAFAIQGRIVITRRDIPSLVHFTPDLAENEVRRSAAWKTRQRDWAKLAGLWSGPPR